MPDPTSEGTDNSKPANDPTQQEGLNTTSQGQPAQEKVGVPPTGQSLSNRNDALAPTPPQPVRTGDHQGNRQQRPYRGRYYNKRNRASNKQEPATAPSQNASPSMQPEQSPTALPVERTEGNRPLTSQQATRQGQDRRDRPVPTEARGGGQGQLQRQQQRTDISVVIPLFNEESSLKELHQQLRTALNRMNTRYELLFVDDGSTDKSYQVLRDLKRTDHRIKIVRFRRNFGKSAALAVGFEYAQGTIVITMDADLQDDPAEIPNLVRRINEGYDLVSGWKKVRRDPITKTIPSRFFNFVTSVITGIKLHDFNCGLKAYKREVVKTVKVYGELHRFIPVLARWEGFSIGEMIIQHRPRKYGKTKFGIGRFWKGFLDLLTVLFTTRYFRKPLHLFGFWGIVAAFVGIIIIGWLIAEWFTGQTALSNRPLFLGGILLIIVGIQFISIGLLGEMISKTKQVEEQYSIREFVK
jgi:glycosyltransferase involved in cell wall biosynthesis